MDAAVHPQRRPDWILFLGSVDPGVLRTDLENRAGGDRVGGQENGISDLRQRRSFGRMNGLSRNDSIRVHSWFLTASLRLRTLAGILVPALLLAGEAAAQVMTPITARDTPAHLAARRFMRGVNLSNNLDYAPGDPARTQTYSASDFALIRAEAFDHVRVPVAWHLYT